jgi:hypothetical protein
MVQGQEKLTGSACKVDKTKRTRVCLYGSTRKFDFDFDFDFRQIRHQAGLMVCVPDSLPLSVRGPIVDDVQIIWTLQAPGPERRIDDRLCLRVIAGSRHIAAE